MWLCGRPEIKCGLLDKGHDRPAAIIFSWYFMYHTAWWVYLMLGAKGLMLFSWTQSVVLHLTYKPQIADGFFFHFQMYRMPRNSYMCWPIATIPLVLSTKETNLTRISLYSCDKNKCCSFYIRNYADGQIAQKQPETKLRSLRFSSFSFFQIT